MLENKPAQPNQHYLYVLGSWRSRSTVITLGLFLSDAEGKLPVDAINEDVRKWGNSNTFRRLFYLIPMTPGVILPEALAGCGDLDKVPDAILVHDTQ